MLSGYWHFSVKGGNRSVKEKEKFVIPTDEETPNLINSPREIIIMIAMYLDLISLVRFSNTCRKINSMTSNEKMLWKKQFNQAQAIKGNFVIFNNKHDAVYFLEQKKIERNLEQQRISEAKKNLVIKTLDTYSKLLKDIISGNTLIDLKVFHNSIMPYNDILFKSFDDNLKTSPSNTYRKKYGYFIHKKHFVIEQKNEKEITFEGHFDTFTPEKTNFILHSDVAIVFINTADQAKSFLNNINPSDQHKLVFLVVPQKMKTYLQHFSELEKPQVETVCINDTDVHCILEKIFDSIMSKLILIEKQSCQASSVKNRFSSAFGRI